jgi:hypothetical protein
MKKSGFRVDHLVLGFASGAVISSVLLFFCHVSHESAFMLLVFNFLFTSLIFPLNGALTRKLPMLLAGNVICLIWNDLFSLFAAVVANRFGEFFEIAYTILNPFVNLIWVVSFWSISLTVLANSKTKSGGFSLDD